MARSSNPDDQQDQNDIPLPNAYEWLAEQLQGAHFEDEEEPWVDPTGGRLTELLEMCESGQDDRIHELAESLSNHLNTPGPDGDTALHIAALFGNLRCVQALLAHGSKVDLVNEEDGSTALHDASAGGYLEIAELLLTQAPSLVSVIDMDGETALHTAARGGHLEVVRLLLDKGADVTIRNSLGNLAEDEADDDMVKDVLRQERVQATRPVTEG